MKDLLVRVKKFKDTLIAIEMDINVIEMDLNSISKDMVTLTSIKEELEYNIDFLKKEGVIAVASEYKKSLVQLDKVNKKIFKFKTLKNILTGNLSDKEKSHKYYFKEYEKAHRLVENERVIISMDKYRKGKADE